MWIIIDGYNVLKQVFAHEKISESERSAFIALLGRYSKKRGHKIEVVFDRGPCIYPLREKNHGISVVYSGQNHTADDLIISFCKGHPTKEILVVTQDREIIQAVSSGNCEAIEPKIFYNKVKSVFEKSDHVRKRQSGHIVKISESDDVELDLIMREAAGMILFEKNEEENSAVRRHHGIKGHESTKKERKTLKRIDKL